MLVLCQWRVASSHGVHKSHCLGKQTLAGSTLAQSGIRLVLTSAAGTGSVARGATPVQMASSRY
jgi:hypothetical protein